MNLDKLTWYVARSGGIVAWVLLAAGLILGLLLSSRVLGRKASPAWILSVHRFLGGLSVVFTAIHVAAIMLDEFVAFGWVDVLVPWASEWKPSAVAWGIIAMYLMVAIELTSFAMKRLPRSLWRAVHWSSAPLFVVATMHGWQAGTDAGRAFMAAIVATTVVLGVLTVIRVVAARRREAPRDPRALLEEAKARKQANRSADELSVDPIDEPAGTDITSSWVDRRAGDGANTAPDDTVAPAWFGNEPEPTLTDTTRQDAQPTSWFASEPEPTTSEASTTSEPMFGSFFTEAPATHEELVPVSATAAPETEGFAQSAAELDAAASGTTTTEPTFGSSVRETLDHPPPATRRLSAVPAGGPAIASPKAPVMGAEEPNAAFGAPGQSSAADHARAKRGSEPAQPHVPPVNPWADQPALEAPAPALPEASTPRAPMPPWQQAGASDDQRGWATTDDPAADPNILRRPGPVPGVWKRSLQDADA